MVMKQTQAAVNQPLADFVLDADQLQNLDQ